MESFFLPKTFGYFIGLFSLFEFTEKILFTFSLCLKNWICTAIYNPEKNKKNIACNIIISTGVKNTPIISSV